MKKLVFILVLLFAGGMAFGQDTTEFVQPTADLPIDSIAQDSTLQTIIDKIIEDGQVTFQEFLSLFDGVYMTVVFLMSIVVRFIPAVKKVPSFVYVAVSIFVGVGIVWQLLGFAAIWKLVLSAGFTAWLFDILRPILKKLPVIGPILGGGAEKAVAKT